MRQTGERTRLHALRRKALVAGGWGLIVLGVVITPLPGPMGLPVILAGAVILLRNSGSARRRYVHLKRRWPGAFRHVDRFRRKGRGRFDRARVGAGA